MFSMENIKHSTGRRILRHEVEISNKLETNLQSNTSSQPNERKETFCKKLNCRPNRKKINLRNNSGKNEADKYNRSVFIKMII